MPGQLDGKAGVITGATSGLGLEVLHAMTREGASMIAVGRNEQRGRAAVAAVRDEGGQVEFYRADVTREADIAAAIERCRASFGRLDIMHNNAAILATRELHETSNDEWEQTIATNLTAVFWGSKHAVLAMRDNGGGSIINTSSINAFVTTADTAAYSATKSGILGLSRATALAYARFGIRCNALCPGDFDSPMLNGFIESAADPAGERALMMGAYPTGRIVEPSEIASVAVFLASDASRAVSGTSVVVDHALLTKAY